MPPRFAPIMERTGRGFGGYEAAGAADADANITDPVCGSDGLPSIIDFLHKNIIPVAGWTEDMFRQE